MPLEDEQYRPGTRFGRYQIGRALGAGGYGAVYEAVRVDIGKRVALKILHERLSRSPQALRRFMREASAVAQLRHPFIVDAVDYGDVDGVPFFAMEYLDGETLGSALEREGPMSVADALDVALPILAALAVIHERGIVHRDLKPANIFLARELTGRRPKLLDFGIAKVQDAGESLTRSSAVIGTPAYMSPEQVQESKNVDARSDLWAMGVILHECLTGRRLFDGDNLLQQLNSVATMPIPPLRALRPDVPAALEAAVTSALQRDLALRVDAAQTLGAALLPMASMATRAYLGEEFSPRVATAHDTLLNLPVVPPAPAAAAPPPTFAQPESLPTHEIPQRPAGKTSSVVFAGLAACALVFFAAFITARRSAPRVAPRPSPPTVVHAIPRALAPRPATPTVAPPAPPPEPTANGSVHPAPTLVRDVAVADAGALSPLHREQPSPSVRTLPARRPRRPTFRPGRLLRLPQPGSAGSIEMP